MDKTRTVSAQTPNPANEGSQSTEGKERVERKRMPAMGRRKFECDPIPGYVVHVFNEDRVWEAKEAGWELCSTNEVHLNQRGVGQPQSLSGNTDLGACVSIVGNSATNKRGVFMKLKEEWWIEDMEARNQRNAEIMAAIFPGEPVEPLHPQFMAGNRYMKIAFGKQTGELGTFKPALLNRGRRYAQRPFVPHQPYSPRNG
jgi:hypothetical protein